MKTSIFRFVVLGAICASFIGVAAAYGPRDREIKRQIAGLEAAKGRAMAHNHPGKVHAIQRQIDGLRAELHHHHW